MSKLHYFLKKTAGYAALVFIALSILTCATPPRDDTPKTLVLLNTNDHHGSIMPSADGRGGLAERAAYIKSVRAQNQDVLLVDAGDLNTGPALSNMFYAEPDIKAYNMMGYDAVTFGNHEFDKDKATLLKQISEAEFPFLSANIKEGSKFFGGHQYLIKKYNGFTVGLFGITTLRTPVIASPDKSLTFVPEIDAAKAAVKALQKKKVDIIIALTHIGDVKEEENHVTSLELAAAVPGINIIVDGHSHSAFEEPKVVGNTYIVSANEWGKQVGTGKITIAGGNLTAFEWKPVLINKETVPEPDAEVAAMLAPYKEKADAELKVVVGQAKDTFVFGNRLPRYGESTIGNLVLDSMVWYFDNVYGQKVDFALHNGGSIRAELPKGEITQEKVLTVLPFENYLFIVSLKGSEVLELFDFIASIPQGAGGFPQFSKEVRYTLDVPSKKITNLTLGGVPVDPNKTYRLCTNDYLLGGGDGYTILTKAENPFNTSLLLSYVVGEYIKSQGTVSPATDGRMVVTGGVTP